MGCGNYFDRTEKAGGSLLEAKLACTAQSSCISVFYQSTPAHMFLVFSDGYPYPSSAYPSSYAAAGWQGGTTGHIDKTGVAPITQGDGNAAITCCVVGVDDLATRLALQKFNVLHMIVTLKLMREHFEHGQERRIKPYIGSE